MSDILKKGTDYLKNRGKEALKKAFMTFLKTPYGRIFLGIVALLLITIIIIMAIMGNNETSTGDTTEGMYSSSEEQWSQLIKFIGCMEGGATIYKNSSGVDCYKVIFDGAAGNPGIVGLDFVAGGYGSYFSGLGYDISVGALIPVDVVNKKKEEAIIKEYYDPIVSRCSSAGIELTQYQYFALTSRAFNCGVGGAFTSCDEEFTSAYKKYWNKSRDDKYGKSQNPDLTHNLYTRCLRRPNSSRGTYYSALAHRREEEFRLFQCGWYKWYNEIDEGFLESSHSSGGGGGNILETAARIHKYMEDHKYVYDGYYANTFEDSKKYRACVCASFVSWVLIDCGYINVCYHDCGNLDNLLAANKNFERINNIKNVNQLKPGDILIYEGYWSGGYGRVHTEIYAGNNTIYNAGSTNALQRKNPYYKDMQYTINNKPVTRVYRVKGGGTSTTLASFLKNANISEETLEKKGAKQLIVVNSKGIKADVTFFEKQNSGWKQETGLTCKGFVGRNGTTSSPSEGKAATPKGLYSIGDAFYQQKLPQTHLNTFPITDKTYWVDDPNSKYYNTKYVGDLPSSVHAERMWEIKPQYKYGFVINYNMSPIVKGKGSAIFFHVSVNSATGGCVAVGENMVCNYLKKLDKSKKPYILII